MKNLLLIFVVLISFVGSSQNIDYKNFDYNLLQKEVVNQINIYRQTIGLDSLFYSVTLQSNVSEKTSSSNANQDKGFHMEMDRTNSILNENLYNELYNHTNKKCGEKTPSMIFIDKSAEIISIIEGIFLTYEDLSKEILKGWLSSKGHKLIIETKFKDLNNYSGLISCSAKKSKTNKLYVTVNFVTLGYF